MAGKRLSEGEKQAILDDLRATQGTPDGSIAKVARRHERGYGTVKRLADANGFTFEAARSKVKNATLAHAEQCAQLRQAISLKMLLRADRALDQMERPAIIYNFGGKDNTYNEREVSEPPTGDQRNLIVIAATAVDKHGVLERFESDNNARAHMDAYLVQYLFGGKSADGN